MKTAVLGLNGSLRSDSWNLKLLRNFLAQLEADGSFSTQVHPALHLPLLNEELELAPLDSRILGFRAALAAAPVVVVASPEYNGSFSSALKNAVDWATRPPENLWAGKIVVLLSASPGSLGGARGLIQLRTVLSGIKSWVLPEQVQLPFAHKSFDSEGKLLSEPTFQQIASVVESLRSVRGKLLQK